jgi:hypothetical protein
MNLNKVSIYAMCINPKTIAIRLDGRRHDAIG